MLLLRVPSRSGFLAGHCGTSVCTCVQHLQKQLLKAFPTFITLPSFSLGFLRACRVGRQVVRPAVLSLEEGQTVSSRIQSDKSVWLLEMPPILMLKPLEETQASFIHAWENYKSQLQIKKQTAQMQLRSQVTPSVF